MLDTFFVATPSLKYMYSRNIEKETYFAAKSATGGSPWSERTEPLWSSFIGILSK